MAEAIDWRRTVLDIDLVSQFLRDGGLVVLPTDTCYGLACDAFNTEAVSRLRSARQMGETPPAVLVAAWAVVEALTEQVPAYARELADAFWPGPLTMLLRARPLLRWQLGGQEDAVGLRIPHHEGLLEVLKAVGPLAVSTANRVGGELPYTVDAALASLQHQDIGLVVEAGELAHRERSTFVDCRAATPGVLRAGQIRISQLLDVVGGQGFDGSGSAGSM